MHTPPTHKVRLATRYAGRHQLPLAMVISSYLSTYQIAIPLLRRASIPALRLALGVVYIWFGALKVAGVSPVAQLVQDTMSFLGSPWWIVPVVGLAEIGIGAWLLLGRHLRLLLPIFVGHMAGTFAVLITQPAAAFQHGNPLELTSVGEFVIKNLVLLAAGVAVLTRSPTTEVNIDRDEDQAERPPRGPVLRLRSPS